MSRIFFLLSIAWITISAHWGIDFFDEPYRIAMSWRCVLGDHFFTDEKSFHQTSSSLVFPLHLIYFYLFHSADGLVLFLRYAFVPLATAIALLNYWAVKKYVPSTFALALSVLLIFPPFSRDLSYYPLSIFALSASLNFILLALQTYRPIFWIAAGLAQGLCSLCHPLLAVIAVSNATVLFLRRSSRTGLLLYLGGMGLVVLTYLGIVGISPLQSTLAYMGQLAHHETNYAPVREWLAIPMVPYRLIYLGLFVVNGVAWWKGWRWVNGLSLATLPIAVAFLTVSMGYHSDYYYLYFGLLGLPLYFLSPRDSTDKDILSYLLIPGWLAAVMISIGAGWGKVDRMGIGMVSAAIATSLWGIRILGRSSLVRDRLAALFIGLMVVVLWGMDYRAISRRHHILNDQTRIAEGPYRGIRTSFARAAYLDRLQKKLPLFSRLAKRVIFVPHFPAGYLMTALRPAISNVWWTYNLHNQQIGERFLVDYEHYRQQGEVLVVHVKSIYFSDHQINDASIIRNDSILPAIQNRAQRLDSSPDFDFYLDRPS